MATIEASRHAQYKLVELYAEANAMYARLAAMGDHWHHILAKYLGGPGNGLQSRLPAAYHQFITNAQRVYYGFGQGTRLSPDEWMRMLVEVHTRYPLPLIPGAFR